MSAEEKWRVKANSYDTLGKEWRECECNYVRNVEYEACQV